VKKRSAVWYEGKAHCFRIYYSYPRCSSYGITKLNR